MLAIILEGHLPLGIIIDVFYKRVRYETSKLLIGIKERLKT